MKTFALLTAVALSGHLASGAAAGTSTSASTRAPSWTLVQPVQLQAAASAQGIRGEGVAFAGTSDRALFTRAAERLAGIDTMRAKFLQIAPSGTVSGGTLALRRPGQLSFDYDAPNPQSIVATGGLVYVHDAKLETTDSYPVAQTPLKFLLSDRLDTGAARLERVERGTDDVTFVVSSADQELAGRLALTFSAPDLNLTRWAVEEPNGRTTVVDLSDVETGVRLNNRTFQAPDAGGTFLRN